VDSHLRTPLNAQIWAHPKKPWIATLDATTPTANELCARGARVLSLPCDREGQVELSALLTALGASGIRSVMIEGGATIIGNVLHQQLAHHAVITIAPRFAQGVRVDTPPVTAMTMLQDVSYTQADRDIIIWGDLAWTLAKVENSSANAAAIEVPTPTLTPSVQSSAF
jgi:riboflavin biosynthesis pyrimidine reductase